MEKRTMGRTEMMIEEKINRSTEKIKKLTLKKASLQNKLKKVEEQLAEEHARLKDYKVGCILDTCEQHNFSPANYIALSNAISDGTVLELLNIDFQREEEPKGEKKNE